MRIQTKEQTSRNLLPAALDFGWQLFMPAVAGEQDLGDLIETRAALQQAEILIRAQEERIRILEERTQTDELTGLANRRGFRLAFERELHLARRNADCNGILMMLDLDGFKAINDKWGHQAGDVYLRAVAQALRAGVRATDTVARLGGDEFALLFPSMDEKTGLKRLAKLELIFRKRAAALPETVPLRASFGLAPYTGSDRPEVVIRTADLRMYAHKARNKKRPLISSP
ncbi:MAG: GGDEF domain-containing protein [Alphaproteobacteria bacterium]|nr:GGDEF domain-containing protein [Alphaproteobacteria bacterium]